MNTLVPDFPPLFAQLLNWQRLGDRFRGRYAEFSTAEVLSIVAFAAGIAAGVYLLHRLLQRRTHAAAHGSAPELFRELCRAHRLERADRRLLKRLAAAWGLPGPAFLFVEPNYFDTATFPTDWEFDLDRVASIRQRLFDTQ